MTVKPVKHRLTLIITAMVGGALLACALVMGIASLANASTMHLYNFRYTGKVLANPSRTLYTRGEVKATYNPHNFQYGLRMECLQFNRVAGHNRFVWINGQVETGINHWSYRKCPLGGRQYTKVWQAQIRVWNGKWHYFRFYKDPASGLHLNTIARRAIYL